MFKKILSTGTSADSSEYSQRLFASQLQCRFRGFRPVQSRFTFVLRIPFALYSDHRLAGILERDRKDPPYFSMLSLTARGTHKTLGRVEFESIEILDAVDATSASQRKEDLSRQLVGGLSRHLIRTAGERPRVTGYRMPRVRRRARKICRTQSRREEVFVTLGELVLGMVGRSLRRSRVVEGRSVEPLIICELPSCDLRPILRHVTHPLADTVPVTAFLRCHKRTFRTRRSCSLVVSMMELQWWRVVRTAFLFASVLSVYPESLILINDVQRMKLRVSLANRNPRLPRQFRGIAATRAAAMRSKKQNDLRSEYRADKPEILIACCDGGVQLLPQVLVALVLWQIKLVEAGVTRRQLLLAAVVTVDVEPGNAVHAFKLLETIQWHLAGTSDELQELGLFFLVKAADCTPEPLDLRRRGLVVVVLRVILPVIKLLRNNVVEALQELIQLLLHRGNQAVFNDQLHILLLVLFGDRDVTTIRNEIDCLFRTETVNVHRKCFKGHVCDVVLEDPDQRSVVIKIQTLHILERDSPAQNPAVYRPTEMAI
ncbi:hypothetical protein KC350_g76 [Hortaea werneckii]|nr:hypothetical protein KC350_g76 [Hortaea werneckii]